MTKKIDARNGEVWKTAAGHRVRIISSQRPDVIETAYVDGRVNGYLGANFDAATGNAIGGGDHLVEREA